MKFFIAAGLIIILLACFLSLNNNEVRPPLMVEIDSIAVIKHKRKLCAYGGGVLLREYSIALGRQPIGKKHFEGDKKTPEGLYRINGKNANSSYHKNLGVSYPNDSDIVFAGTAGKKPGGDIKIHGLRNGMGKIGRLHRINDWTLGCIALTNAEIDELFEHVRMGSPINIQP